MKHYGSYKKELNYSYALGVFPTLELLQARPEAVRTVILSARGERNTGVQQIRTLCAQQNIAFEVDDGLVERLARSENCYAVAVFEKYETVLEQGDHLVLAQPSDRGNLGTIMRTMLGFGYRDLALIRPAVDHFDPKVVRAAMGAVFSLRVAYFDQFEDYVRAYDRPRYLFMLEGARPLAEVSFRQPHSLVFGNEGAGLPAEYTTRGEAVRIEQNEAIDSLNLAMAVGIGLYASYAQRLAKRAVAL